MINSTFPAINTNGNDCNNNSITIDSSTINTTGPNNIYVRGSDNEISVTNSKLNAKARYTANAAIGLFGTNNNAIVNNTDIVGENDDYGIYGESYNPVSYTHLRAHETIGCRRQRQMCIRDRCN